MKDANGSWQTQPISQYYMVLNSSTNTTAVFNSDAGEIQVIVDGVASILQGTQLTLSGGKFTYIYGDNITRLTASNLTSLNVGNNPKLVYLNCANGSLSTSNINSILSSLVSHGLSNGSVDLRNNSAPSSRTHIDTLESRGWTVLTDYVDPVLSDSAPASDS